MICARTKGDSMKPFWIVVSEEHGPSSRPFRHTSPDSATKEAERLCRVHGGAFFVMEAISVSRKTDVTTTKMDDIPFSP